MIIRKTSKEYKQHEADFLRGRDLYRAYLDEDALLHVDLNLNFPGIPTHSERLGAALRELFRVPALYNNQQIRKLLYQHPPHEMIIADAIIDLFAQFKEPYHFFEEYFIPYVNSYPKKSAMAAEFLGKIFHASFIPSEIKNYSKQYLDFVVEIYGVFWDLKVANLLDKHKERVVTTLLDLFENENLPAITDLNKVLNILLTNKLFTNSNIKLLFESAGQVELIRSELLNLKKVSQSDFDKAIKMARKLNKTAGSSLPLLSKIGHFFRTNNKIEQSGNPYEYKLLNNGA